MRLALRARMTARSLSWASCAPPEAYALRSRSAPIGQAGSIRSGARSPWRASPGSPCPIWKWGSEVDTQFRGNADTRSADQLASTRITRFSPRQRMHRDISLKLGEGAREQRGVSRNRQLIAALRTGDRAHAESPADSRDCRPQRARRNVEPLADLVDSA
jgi:hypothetical protein